MIAAISFETFMEWKDQCKAIYPLPFQYKGTTQLANCILKKDHEGSHKTSEAYGSREFTKSLIEEKVM